MRRFHAGASLSPYGCDMVVIRFRHIIQTVLLQNFKKPFPQWRLQDFFVGGAKGGLTVQRVLKKLIKLIESNERLTLAISFLYTAALKKAFLTFFPVVLNFSYATD